MVRFFYLLGYLLINSKIYMKKVIRLTESDLARIVKRVILEQVDSTVLKLGSKGPQVGELQKKLGITVDNDFGVNTDAAVKAFQTKNGLTADGIVGPTTLAKLGGNTKPIPNPEEKSTAFKAGKKTKEILITVGKVVITIVLLPVGAVVLIGALVYKIAAAALKALISLLTSLAKITNQIIIKPAIELTKATGDLLVKLGVGIWKGLVFVATGIAKVIEKTAEVITKILGAIWGAGKWVFLKALTMAKMIPELFRYVGNWIDKKGEQVAKLLGKTWDYVVDAFNKGKQEVINAAKQALETGKKIGDFIKAGFDATVQGVKDFAKGFMSEGYVDHLIVNEHYNYYSKLNTATLLKESSR